MLLSVGAMQSQTMKYNFNKLSYEVIFVQYLSKSKFDIQPTRDKFFTDVLQVKFSGTEPVTICFGDKFRYTPKALDSFHGGIPFYLNLTQLHKNKETPNEKYSYADFYLDMYNLADEKIGQTSVKPNTNTLLDEDYLSKIGIKLSDISYFKLSLVIKEPCKFYLHYFTFAFSDFMSTDSFYSTFFDVTVRLQINNLKKKKNGVVIFFPSFYIKERDSESISHGDNSVKWPNFTRHTWASDLDNICTIFVSDPFQYTKGNDSSSWFFARDGQSILPEIASYIRSILNIQTKEQKFQSTNSLNHYLQMAIPYGTSKGCGPIITYGSSMGGFAAFLFSCYLEPTLCFCECPQANLIKYKYSKEYLETCSGLGLNDIPLLLSSYPANERNKKKEQIVLNIVQKYDLSLSAILRNHKPKFRSLIHFYSIDKLHLTSFDNEIQSLTDEERKQFNYQLVIENDLENQLFSHQAMPKDKVLEIFKYYLTNSK